MLIKDIMSKPAITIKPDQSVLEAQLLMQKHNIRRLPVLRSGQVVGIITDKDVQKAKPSILADLPEPEANDVLQNTLVQDAMTEDVVSVDSEEPLEQAVLLMNENKIGGLPVMEKKQLAGVITETDIFRLVGTLLGAEPGYFQVVLLDTPETRTAVQRLFAEFPKRIRSIIFSPKYPEIVMVFKAPGGKEDSRRILEDLKKYSFQILDWHLFESKKEAIPIR